MKFVEFLKKTFVENFWVKAVCFGLACFVAIALAIS